MWVRSKHGTTYGLSVPRRAGRKRTFGSKCNYSPLKDIKSSIKSLLLQIGGGVLGDCWKPEERGQAIALYSLAPLLGPVIGPVAGAWIAEKSTWRWVVSISLHTLRASTAAAVIFVTETSRKNASAFGWLVNVMLKLNLLLDKGGKKKRSINIIHPLQHMKGFSTYTCWSLCGSGYTLPLSC